MASSTIPGMMGHRMAYTAESEINRKDFGLTFNMMLDGRWIVSDEVKINIELELVEKKEEAAAGAVDAADCIGCARTWSRTWCG